jgi:hypothetical protein
MNNSFILDRYKKRDSQFNSLIGFCKNLTSFIIYSWRRRVKSPLLLLIYKINTCMKAKIVRESLNEAKKDWVEELRKELNIPDEEFDKLSIDDLMKLANMNNAVAHVGAAEKDLQKELKDPNKALIFDPKNQCYGYVESFDRKNHRVNIVCTHTVGFQKLPQPKKDKIRYDEYEIDDKFIGSLERRYKRLLGKIKRETQKVKNIQDMVNYLEKTIKEK